MKKEQISGLVMAIVGFIMILVNAISYIFQWGEVHPAFGIVGLVFCAVGAMRVRKNTPPHP
jgi:predicted membrane protein